MAETTGIAWCDSTFNPWIGCTKVSPGCDHCYAEKVGARMQVRWGVDQPRKRTSVSNWQQVIRWNERAAKSGKRHLVFCASLADVFDNAVPDRWRWDLMRLIDATPALTWLLLTKRIGNARTMLNNSAAASENGYVGQPSWDEAPRRNVWLGISVVNQEEADRDIPKLLATPAAKRFISYEPALGPVNFGLLGTLPGEQFPGYQMAYDKVDWIIVGGESGPGARPFNITWARDTVEQCREAGVAPFVKQLGTRPYWDCVDGFGQWPSHVECDRIPAQNAYAIQLCDIKGGDPKEWPEDLRVREFPV